MAQIMLSNWRTVLMLSLDQIVRVVVTDDDVAVRQSVVCLLKGQKEIELVGTHDRLRRALDHLPVEKPDVLLADLLMPEMNGLEFLLKLAAVKKAPGVLMMTGFAPPNVLGLLRLAGARGCILKPFDKEDLKRAIIEVAQGNDHWPEMAPGPCEHCMSPSDPLSRLAEWITEALFGPDGSAMVEALRDAVARACAFHPGELSLLCRVSTATLERRCRARFGVSPRVWLRQRQMNEAHDLLLVNCAESDIAAQTGFRHLANFTRGFARYFGFPPRECRP